MTAPIAKVDFPPEWFGDETWLPGFPQIIEVLTHNELPDETLFIAGGVLAGGTNLIALAWSSGAHLMRCAPPAWAVEERVDADAPAQTRDLWRSVVKSMIGGYRAARAEVEES